MQILVRPERSVPRYVAGNPTAMIEDHEICQKVIVQWMTVA